MQQTLCITISANEFQEMVRTIVREEVQRVCDSEVRTTDKHLMTIPEVCEYYDIANGTLRKILSKREIPSYKRGKRVWIDRKDIEAYIRNGKRASRSQIRADI